MTYRNRPLARIAPIPSDTEPLSGDPIFRLHELAEEIGPLTSQDIDALIYGQGSPVRHQRLLCDDERAGLRPLCPLLAS